MARKHKCPPAGAPEWVLTYGDMMSLLLCFFILLAALSELKKEDQYHAIVKEVQAHFGMKGGGGATPTDMDPKKSLIQTLDALRLQRQEHEELSESQDPGVEGKKPTVTQVREGLRFLVGSRVTFEPGSADLNDRGRQALREIAELVRGYNNIVELRGHAATGELVESDRFRDARDISYARAKAVEVYLVGDDCRVEPERIRLIACSDREPLVKRVYQEHELEPNRRVEVIVSESLVEEFTRPEQRR